MFGSYYRSCVLLWCTAMIVTAGEISVSICQWRGDAQFAFSIIHDDFGDANYTPEILKAGTLAYERGLKIASAAVVKRMVDAGEERWHDMNSFIAQGHEIVNHSWNHNNPTSAIWDDYRDLVETKDSLEAHLADSVWQKEISFYCFPEDAGTKAQLDSLQKYGYIGARWREGYEGDRVNSGGSDFTPFQSDFYGYISKEYGDSVLAQMPNSNYTDWWLTYPDKPYFNYKSPIEKLEQRHLDKAQECGAWGLMEMHAIAPSQLYPEGTSWWSPMSYTKYERLLDRLQALQLSDSLWMDVPSKIASYITLKNGCALSVTDSGIHFDYASVDARYLTELTLKVATGTRELTFVQDGIEIPSLPQGEDTLLIHVNPANGPVQISGGTAVVESSASLAYQIGINAESGRIAVTFPTGRYKAQLFDLRGRAVSATVQAITSESTTAVFTGSFAAGSYLLQVESDGLRTARQILVR